MGKSPDIQDGREAVAAEGSGAPAAGDSLPTRWGRRRFLRRMAAGGALVLGGGAYAWCIEPTWVKTVCRPMPMPNLPAELEGFRIIQLSDLHMGTSVPLAYLAKCVGWVNDRRADLIVVTGDLVHQGRGEWSDPTARLLARLRANQGVLTVLGNHDWGANTVGQSKAACADRIEAAMIERDVRVLRNETVTLRRGSAQLHIVGLDDCWGDRYEPVSAFVRVPASDPCIALAHNPDSFVDILDSPACWTLAGHTHGGQVSLPFYGPPVLIPVRHTQFVAGHYRVAGKNLYVNRGLGWVKRIRFNARPEITEFTLTRA